MEGSTFGSRVQTLAFRSTNATRSSVGYYHGNHDPNGSFDWVMFALLMLLMVVMFVGSLYFFLSVVHMHRFIIR